MVQASPEARPETAVAGEAIDAGEVVYLDTGDTDANGKGKAKLAQCDGTALQATVKGIAINSAAAGQVVAIHTTGALTVNSVLTQGVTYYLSATAGKIAPRADLVTGNDVVLLGTASSATSLTVKIDNTGITVP